MDAGHCGRVLLTPSPLLPQPHPFLAALPKGRTHAHLTTFAFTVPTAWCTCSLPQICIWSPHPPGPSLNIIFPQSSPDHPETRPGSSSMRPPAPCLFPCPDCLGGVPDHFSCAHGLPCLTPCPTSRATVRRNWASALEFTRQENATAQGGSLAQLDLAFEDAKVSRQLAGQGVQLVATLPWNPEHFTQNVPCRG